MEKLTFRVDDPEVLEFIYSLGRERSKVICQLIRDCMDEGGGYVPPRIMAATGFSYKNKKSIKRTGTVVTSKPSRPLKQQKSPNKEAIKTVTQTEETKQPVSAEPEAAISVTPEPIISSEHIESKPAEPAETPKDEETYVSSAPKINNSGLIMAGLSAFGGV
jgi:hypothetical protein